MADCPVSDNTAAEGLTPCAYHRFYEPACRNCAAASSDGGPFLPSPIPPQCELVDKAALDALREAVKLDGCHNRAPCPHGTTRCGTSFHDGASDEGVIYLCDIHAAKRDAAIRRLLGSEIEGDSNG